MCNKKETATDKGVFTHEQIKAIRTDLHIHTGAVIEALETDYNTSVLCKTDPKSLSFIFRPNLNTPEDIIEVFTIQQDPRDNKWMLTTIGGDFQQEVIKTLLELLNLFNQFNLKKVEIWYK